VYAMATLSTDGRRGERGQAIVELALTLPLLMLVVLGVFDFGLMFERFEVVTNAAREGARIAVLPDYVDPHQAELRAESYLNSGGIAGASVYANCATGALSAGRICVTAEEELMTIPATGLALEKTVKVMKVTVTYDHQHIFVGPITQMFGGSLGTTRLTAVSRMRKEST
jgi:Flp pilus assembly protein TadG